MDQVDIKEMIRKEIPVILSEKETEEKIPLNNLINTLHLHTFKYKNVLYGKTIEGCYKKIRTFKSNVAQNALNKIYTNEPFKFIISNKSHNNNNKMLDVTTESEKEENKFSKD